MRKEETPKFEIEETLRITRPVTRELYEAATFLWQTGRKVNEENLTKMADNLKIDADIPSIKDMVKISDFLDLVCR